LNEFQLDEITKQQIRELLRVSFPDEDFRGRTYFKQLPHYRLLLKHENFLVGQLGLYYRVMTLRGEPIRVLGIIDLAIVSTYQGQGLGTELLQEVDSIAQRHSNNIDFLILIDDKHR
jgi:GNAT superfamily N-acetyltransferase